MQKDFDKWNNLKKTFEKEERELFAHPREIWWCSLGINLGAEIDGKNDSFERPVLVMNVYSRETMFVLPITSKERNDKFHHKIFVKIKNIKTGEYEEKSVWVKLTQARVISNKRLLRKVDLISIDDFNRIMKVFKNSI
ncbi:MAG: type II toxin-antitoxin system PemK/MazF family toxin [Candidatus Parcubacteria bacterium]|nr:type II toxin-antitoxin system PemK/MazF family toxin [Candidatus Parcubacteria bacterium]